MSKHAEYIDFAPEIRRSNWVRLHTLTTLRWIAIFGQVIALTVAHFGFGLVLDIGWFSVVIGAAIIFNTFCSFVFPPNTRLTEGWATRILLFDITQLSALLILSGGLHNPFALLILAPVSISASALQPKSAILTGAVAIFFVSVAALFHVPLTTISGDTLSVSNVFVFGSWAGIVIGVVFLGVFSWRVASEIHTMSEALIATQMALSREQKLTDLGGVVAAAAHELGTPLATIKLTSTELADDLSDRLEQQEDALLIRDQADRCRDILRAMGQSGKDDLHMRITPLLALIEEAAEPHTHRGKSVIIATNMKDKTAEHPFIYRKPEIIHGLRNLIQNAVDFSETTVWVDVSWDETSVSLRILDDGAGFPSSMLGRIGDPFVHRGRPDRQKKSRPGYEGMGMGLFIAKTLLERTGADITFANGAAQDDLHLHAGRRSGAIVELTWPFGLICLPDGEQNEALGENTRFGQDFDRA